MDTRPFQLATALVLLLPSLAATACEPAAATPGEPMGMLRPVDAAIVAGFGPWLHPILQFVRPHNGVDFAGPIGLPVRAAQDGWITEARYRGETGNHIRIEHGQSLVTTYSHLSRYAPTIDEGACVKQGDIIGFLGSTGLSAGPHLHFEVLQAGVPVDPAPASFGPVI